MSGYSKALKMEQYSFKELTDMIIVYSASGCSAQKAEHLYREKFPKRHNLNWKRLISIHRNSQETGSFKPQRTGQGARHKTVQTPVFEEMMLDHVIEVPSRTARFEDSGWKVLKEQLLIHIIDYGCKQWNQLIMNQESSSVNG